MTKTNMPAYRPLQLFSEGNSCGGFPGDAQTYTSIGRSGRVRRLDSVVSSTEKTPPSKIRGKKTGSPLQKTVDLLEQSERELKQSEREFQEIRDQIRSVGIILVPCMCIYCIILYI